MFLDIVVIVVSSDRILVAVFCVVAVLFEKNVVAVLSDIEVVAVLFGTLVVLVVFNRGHVPALSDR